MGMVRSGAMATQVKPVEHLTWMIPKDWSLRDGATIPAVYITVYYAFFFGKSVVRGNSILIHAGKFFLFNDKQPNDVLTYFIKIIQRI